MPPSDPKRPLHNVFYKKTSLFNVLRSALRIVMYRSSEYGGDSSRRPPESLQKGCRTGHSVAAAPLAPLTGYARRLRFSEGWVGGDELAYGS